MTQDITPDFKLRVDDTDYTNKIRDRLVEIRLTDVAGGKSDYLEITLDDREPIASPSHGAELWFELGYKETGLYPKGIYTHDQTEFTLPPKTMLITGHGVNFRSNLKSSQTRTYKDLTLKDIVATIGAAHGYSYKVDDFLAPITIPYLMQTNESDLKFLTRLAGQYDAMFKVQGNVLLFIPRDAYTRPKYQAMLPQITLGPTDVTRLYVSNFDKTAYGSVVASWYDKGAAAYKKETAGSGSPVRKLPFNYSTAAEAAAAANAKLKELTRGKATLQLTLPGNPKLIAEGGIILKGFRDGVDGEFTITRVEHILNKTVGYQCNVEGKLTAS